MLDEEFEGWRITVADDGSCVYFSNKPLVEKAKKQGQSEPDLRYVGLPVAVLRRGQELADSV
jgi:hypothetical protein